MWIGGGRMHAALHYAWAHTSRTRAASRWQVWQSLPSSLQQAFASQKIALVELALKLLLDEVGGRAGAGAPDAALFGGKVLGQA